MAANWSMFTGRGPRGHARHDTATRRYRCFLKVDVLCQGDSGKTTKLCTGTLSLPIGHPGTGNKVSRVVRSACPP